MPVGKVFLNYRRDDSEGYVGRLYDHLNRRFPGRIFRDVTELRPGEDFVDALEREGLSCQVLLAVIGRRWLTMDDASGKRRIDDPDDILRQEIAHALNRNILTIPVLVGGADMPLIDQLPAELSRLGRRQALPISELDFEHDIERLFRALEQALGEQPTPQPIDNNLNPPPGPPPPPPRKPNRLLWVGGGVLAAAVLFGIASTMGPHPNPPGPVVNPNPADSHTDNTPRSSEDDDNPQKLRTANQRATKSAAAQPVQTPAQNAQQPSAVIETNDPNYVPPNVQSTVPRAAANVSNIMLRYTGDQLGGCNPKVGFNIGGRVIVPNSNPFYATGVPNGNQPYVTTGTVVCPTGTCRAYGQGSVFIHDRAVFDLVWQLNGYQTCGVTLLPVE